MLRHVRFMLPRGQATFVRSFLGILASFGTFEEGRWLHLSSARLLPEVSLGEGDVPVPTVEFVDDDLTRRVGLTNTTGIERPSPYEYTHISLEDYLQRSRELRLAALDHVGFDLPWFAGTHPEVLALREALAGGCAYHRYPTGEDWDFILPATPEEIAGADLDPDLIRRPKVEIVSLDTSSVPLIQVDLAVDLPYDALARRFPEGLRDPSWRNVWVYLDNPYGIDICLVLNEATGGGDWSHVFRGHRLLSTP